MQDGRLWTQQGMRPGCMVHKCATQQGWLLQCHVALLYRSASIGGIWDPDEAGADNGTATTELSRAGKSSTWGHELDMLVGVVEAGSYEG